MSGYFDRLEAHLLVAVRSQAHQATATTVRRRRFSRRRSLTLVFVALVVCGSAAAAAVKLAGSESHSLSGRLPLAPAGAPGSARPVSGDAYRISVSPDLEAGDVGWCTSISYSSHDGWGSCETGGGYPSTGSPLFGPSASSGSPGANAHRPASDRVVFVLAGPRVAAVRIGHSTVLAAPQPGLPAGDRAAVFFVPGDSPPVAIPPSGVPYPYRFTLESWSVSGTHPRRERAIPMLALDAAGNVIRYARRSHSRRALVRTWWRGASRSLRAHGTTTRPRHGVCRLSARPSRATVATFGRTLSRLVPVQDVEGQAFMSCVWTVFTFHGRPLSAAVLLDARRPGSALTEIPGARPLAGHPGYVNATLNELSGGLTARRAGDAWIVVQGHFGLAMRLGLLEELSGGLAR